MHKLFISLLAFILVSVSVPVAHAGSAAVPVRIVYADTHVSQTVYQELVHSTAQGIKGMSILNTGAFPIKIAVGAAGAEVAQVIAPGTINTIAQLPVVYPLVAGYASRFSVISLNGTNSTGELEVNLFYN